MKAVVWTKDNCPYCTQAKDLLTQKNIEVEERRLGYNWTTESLLEAVPGARSVPQIFLDGVYVGGFRDLVNKLEVQNVN